MKKILGLGIVLAAFSTAANAQSTETGTANATIVEPIVVTELTQMNFGNLSVSSTTAGTVSLSAALATNRTKTGGVIFPVLNGTIAAGAFKVDGQANYTYDITLPANGVVTISNGSVTMDVDDFACDLGATGTLNGSGTQTFYVGATLSVDAGQASGAYDGTYDVTVNYN